MSPTGLNNADIGRGKMRDHFFQEIRLWDKVSVKNGDKLAARGLKPVFERAGLEALPVDAVNVMNSKALAAVVVGEPFGFFPRFISGIVQYLNFQFFPRVIKAANAVDKAFYHISFVINRQLNCHQRPFLRRRDNGRGGCPPPFIVKKDY